MNGFLRIQPRDDVAVALTARAKGDIFTDGDLAVTAAEPIPQGHKMALRALRAGEAVIKYGHPIGVATRDIPIGGWVHLHNVDTALKEHGEYTYTPVGKPLPPIKGEGFMGYLREDGRAGIRNEIWILPLVGCVNDIARSLAHDNEYLLDGLSVDGICAFPHPYGCSQMGEDHRQTRKLLAALARHPNAGGVLVMGLGCEDLTMEQFKGELGEWDERRVRFLTCQQVEDEVAEATRMIKELIEFASGYKRELLGMDKLVLGMKCGGSDGLSGITANPMLGAMCDTVVASGGSVLLTEVPEMFGAEDVLMGRAVNERVFNDIVSMINGFKHYFTSHNQVIYDNPAPGNKDGGITTLEDKSLGCIQKGGTAPVSDVLDYATAVRTNGLSLVNAPGNDLVSTTALAAAGAQMVLFTTGRGTPFGAPVPTVKIATNSDLATRKPNWIDFNAGVVAEGTPIRDAADELLTSVLSIASGRQKSRSEALNYRDLAIWKGGVTV